MELSHWCNSELGNDAGLIGGMISDIEQVLPRDRLLHTARGLDDATARSLAGACPVGGADMATDVRGLLQGRTSDDVDQLMQGKQR
jgi:hypothetical protein